jgi:hypothetical protein
MYSQTEAIKQKYATARFVSWRDLKQTPSIRDDCCHYTLTVATSTVLQVFLQWVNYCLVVVAFFFMMSEDDGGDF